MYFKSMLLVALVITAGKVLALSSSQVAQYNQQARQIVSDNLDIVQNNYSGYSGGYRTRTEFVTQKTNAEEYADALARYKEFRINVPNRLRKAILEKGYLNQHQTGTTNGCLCPDSRNGKEAAMINWPKANYVDLAPYVKPKYGSLGIEGVALYGAGASQYGDDVYIFDEEKLQGRVTYTLADSLGISSSYFNNQNPIFVPMDFYELLVGGKLMLSSLANIGSSIYLNNYTEIQIWGVLTMDLLKEFRFKTAPPSEELAEFFIKNDIRIRQIVCSGNKPGDESCLKDYVLPSLLAFKNAIKENKLNEAQKKVEEMIQAGFNLNLILEDLPANKRRWLTNIVLNSKDFKNQKVENMLTFIQKVDSDELLESFVRGGDLEEIITYWLNKSLPESELPLSEMVGLLQYNLEPEKIKEITQKLPRLRAILTQKLEKALQEGDREFLESVNTAFIALVADESLSSQELLKRVFKGNNPYSFFEYSSESLKETVLSKIKNCLAQYTECKPQDGLSASFLMITFIENLDIERIDFLWKSYFDELVNPELYGKQGSIIDIVTEVREKPGNLDRLYETFNLATINYNYRPDITPYELAVELSRDEKNLSSKVVDDLAATLLLVPHQAIYFPSKGLSAPVVPSYYHMNQVRYGSIVLPEIYPISAFVSRTMERSLNDPNTSTYRMIMRNASQIFIQHPEFQGEYAKAFDEMRRLLPSQYHYSIFQTKAYLKWRIERAGDGDSMHAIKSKLLKWKKLNQEEKDLFIKGMDIVPLLILEEMDNKSLLGQYKKEVESYLNGPEFKTFSKTPEFETFKKERAAWRNYFNGHEVSNSIDDFLQKLKSH